MIKLALAISLLVSLVSPLLAFLLLKLLIKGDNPCSRMVCNLLDQISLRRKEEQDVDNKHKDNFKDIKEALTRLEYRIELIENNPRTIQCMPTIKEPTQQPTQHPIQLPTQSSTVKTIFLGINSDDFFFNNVIEEQKSATSKFEGRLTSESEGIFFPIDVERIRSVNVTSSVKRHGKVSLKDAQSLTVIEPGKICKEDQGWSIKEPAIVKFSK